MDHPQSSSLAACIDFSTSKTLLGLVNEQGKVLARAAWKYPAFHDPNALVRGLVKRLHDLANQSGLDWRFVVGVGYSTYRLMDVESGFVLTSPRERSWQNVPLKALLQQAFALPVWIEMDANAAAQAEAWLGAGKNADPLIYLIIGNGVGAGILLEGRVLRGWRGTAGEAGHTVIDPHGPPCHCGQRGCLQSLVSAPAITRRARQLGWKDPQGGENTPEAIFSAARMGDTTALDIVQQTTAWLGIGLTNLIHLFNPQVIALGGEVILNGADLMLEPLRNDIARRAGYWVDMGGTRIEISQLGENTNLIGAAHLVWSSLVAN
jgi:predicted NBD/HSP70 family sugar kinase